MATIKFEKDSIIIFKGDTYANLNWFRSSGATYSSLWGWWFQKIEDLPTDYPEDLTPLILPLAEIQTSAGVMLDDEKIKAVVSALIYPEDEIKGEFIGDIKERLNIYLTLNRIVSLANYGSVSNIFIFSDDLGNTFTWTTATTPNMEEGHTYNIRGTVKDHRVYKGVRQTVLTRCKIDN